MDALLAGAVTPAQAGAFLVAMRIKGETPEEMAGITQALRDRALALEARSQRTLVCCAGAYDGCVEAPALSIATGVIAAGAGAGIVIHCGTSLGPKHGVTSGAVLEALGGDGAPSPQASEAMLERSGVALVHAGISLAGWSTLAAVRDEIGLRGPVHSAEKLVNWFGARRFIVGYTHSAYAERLCGALELLGAERAFAVRGVEGSDVMRPGRPTAHSGGEPLDLPQELDARLANHPGAGAGAELTRAILDGGAGRVETYTAVLNAGLRLHAAGLAPNPLRGMAQARSALGDGRAAATLEALVGR
jgi:anthranilate phosphoribosyltransferase